MNSDINKDNPVEEQKPKSFIEEIMVINNKTDEKYTYKSNGAPHGLTFGFGKDPGTVGMIIINRLFSADGKKFEGVARLFDFSIINIKLK